MVEENVKQIVDESPLAEVVSDLTNAVDEAVRRSEGAKNNLLNGVLPATDHGELETVLDAKVQQWAGLVKASVYMDAAKEIQFRGGIAEDDITAKLEAEEVVTVSFFDFALKLARQAADNPQVLADIDVNELQLFVAGSKTNESMHAADQVVTQISNGYLVRELAAELDRRLTLGDAPELASVVDEPEAGARLTALLRVVEDDAGVVQPQPDGDDPGF